MHNLRYKRHKYGQIYTLHIWSLSSLQLSVHLPSAHLQPLVSSFHRTCPLLALRSTVYLGADSELSDLAGLLPRHHFYQNFS